MQKPQPNTDTKENLPLGVIYDFLCSLIDDNIEEFYPFLKESELEYREAELIKKGSLEQEDDITLPFSRFFRNLNSQFDFEPQSKTPESNATTDIGIIAKRYSKHRVICFVEAKRLPTPLPRTKREETEYVYYKNESKQGGIERFKTEKHAGKEKLSFSIMLGYIQKETNEHWYSEINKWIDGQISASSNQEISWINQDKLTHDTTFQRNKVTKYNSIHSRKTLNDLKLLHYWIDLT